MGDLYTVEEFAEELGIEPDLARNWCERGLVDCARLPDGELLIGERELRGLSAGIDPAERKGDRVELFSRVNSDEPPGETATYRRQYPVYARFRTRFARQPVVESNRSEDDAAYYLERFSIVAHRLADVFDDSPTRLDRTIEAVSRDVAEAVAPLKGTANEAGERGLRAVLEWLDALLEGRSTEVTIVVRTTIRNRSADGVRPVTLETSLTAATLGDSEAVAVPTAPDERAFPVYQRYCSEWRTALASFVEDRPEGGTVTIAFAPTPTEAFNFEFRAATRRPSEDAPGYD